MRGESSGLQRKWLRRALLSAVACLLAAPLQAQRIGPAPMPHTSPPIRIEPMRPIETTPIQPMQPMQPVQPLQPTQPLPVNPAPQATAVVPYCDKYPDQCRRDHHATHAHPPHDNSQCPCEWYDHNGKRWISGQYAKSCCR